MSLFAGRWVERRHAWRALASGCRSGTAKKDMTEIPSEHQSYLNRLHTQWSTAEDQLRDLVRRSCGCDWSRLERVVKGGANEVYMVTTDGGEELVVRILREIQLYV
jgi:hypothetical protein